MRYLKQMNEHIRQILTIEANSKQSILKHMFSSLSTTEK
jgi:hypothetical protein